MGWTACLAAGSRSTPPPPHTLRVSELMWPRLLVRQAILVTGRTVCRICVAPWGVLSSPTPQICAASQAWLLPGRWGEGAAGTMEESSVI
jgi:hypothetical protein